MFSIIFPGQLAAMDPVKLIFIALSYLYGADKKKNRNQIEMSQTKRKFRQMCVTNMNDPHWHEWTFLE